MERVEWFLAPIPSAPIASAAIIASPIVITPLSIPMSRKRLTDSIKNWRTYNDDAARLLQSIVQIDSEVRQMDESALVASVMLEMERRRELALVYEKMVGQDGWCINTLKAPGVQQTHGRLSRSPSISI